MIRSDLALAALATAAVPGMRPVSVAAIRTGEDTPPHQCALIEDVTGRQWLIRSPLGAAAGAELERNDDLVRQLGRHLPFKVPAAAGYADLGPDGRAVVYPYVGGLALNLRHLPVGPGLASAVGRAIAAVHNMPRELFEEFAVPVFDADQVRARKLAELDRAAETGHVPNGLLARWEQALDAVPMWRFTTVPTHGTLDGSSFLVAFSDDSDAASGRVVGLTGWERAEVADPAEDFARLVELANPRAVDSTFESYSLARSHRPDGYLLHRARLASEMRLLAGLAAAVGRQDETFVRRRADELRKLDRLTTSDTSLVPRTALTPVTAVPDPAASTAAAEADAPVPRVSAAGAETSGIDTDTGTDRTTAAQTDPGASEPAVTHHATPEASGTDEHAEVDVLDEFEAPGEDEVHVPDQPATHAPATHAQDETTVHVLDEAGETDDDPVVVVEPPAEGTHLEPVSAADVTAPIPRFHPVGGPEGQATPPRGADQDSPSAVAPGPEGPGPGNEPAETQAGLVTEPAVGAEPVVTEPESGTGPRPESGEQAGQSGPAAGEADDQAAREADDRLHTLYGMPEESDLDAAAPDGR